jgi:plastocyanin
MDTLDSRSLRYTDTYSQRFGAPGVVRYGLSSSALACLPLDDADTFEIEVRESGRRDRRDGAQHDVTVRSVEGRLVADPERLSIEAGDIVMWYTPDADTPAFAVRGQGERFGFDSTSLTAEALYSHAFGTPGTYRWTDANGTKIGGEIRVGSLDPNDRDECDRWLKALQNGQLITVEGERARPETVEILAGQTVFWAVVKSGGITVTDEILVPGFEPREG